MKASRFCTNRKVLADGEASIEIFLDQGLTELGDRLGPILWQFMADQEVRLRRLRRLPRPAARQPGRPAAAATWSRCATPASPTRSSSALCRKHGVTDLPGRPRELSDDPRRHRRLGLPRLQIGVRRRSRPPTRPPTSTSGPAASRPTPQGGVPGDLPADRPHRRRPTTPARRLRLRHPRGEGPRARPPPWQLIERVDRKLAGRLSGLTALRQGVESASETPHEDAQGRHGRVHPRRPDVPPRPDEGPADPDHRRRHRPGQGDGRGLPDAGRRGLHLRPARRRGRGDRQGADPTPHGGKVRRHRLRHPRARGDRTT